MAKVFQILVPDNTLVSRIISCENQVTELFVIDRADKNFVSDYSADLTKPALYILVNRDQKKLYVGETDDSIKRLRNHEAKDFWTEAIVFHSTGDTLSTTEVRWLEAKTYESLASLGYYDLSENKKIPQAPPLKKNQKYILEPIFEEAKNYICAAGFDIFLKRKVDDIESPQKHDNGASTLSNNVWLVPFNQLFFDLKGCLDKYERVYWSQKCNYKVGDKVFIYSSFPDSAITYCFKVEKTDIEEVTEGDEFRLEKLSFKQLEKRSLFVPYQIPDCEKLKLNYLKEYGLKGAPLGAFRLSQDKYKDLLEYIESNTFEYEHSKKGKRPIFHFSMCDIKTGEKIIFEPCFLEVTVADDLHVEYQGEKYRLSAFAKKYMPAAKRTPSDAYQGSLYFSYNGQILEDIRKKKENQI